MVEAKGTRIDANSQLRATLVEFEGPILAGTTGDHVEIYGFITWFASAQDFDVYEIPVTTGASTLFEGGTPGDLGLSVRVEIEGDLTASGTVAAARVIIFPSPTICVSALLDSVAIRHLVLLGMNFRYQPEDATMFNDWSSAIPTATWISQLVPGDYVKVLGFRATATTGTSFARTVTRLDPVSDTVLTAPVTSVGNPSFTVQWTTIETSNTTTFRDTDDSVIQATEFFGELTEGTRVRVTGIETADTTITAEEVKLQLAAAWSCDS